MKNKRKSLCCISLMLPDDVGASCMTKKRFLMLERKTALKIVSERTLNNLRVTYKTLEHCVKNKWNYRISSGIIPLITLSEANISIDILPDKEQIYSEFKNCANIIQKNKLRCSTHPDQFVVPASLNLNTVKKSIIELQHHADMMDLFGLPRSYESPINIHMNCYKGSSLKDTADRFIKIYNSLNENVKSRLVLENEDKTNSWNVKQLYDYIYTKTNIPITYDNLHFKNNTGNLSNIEAYTLAKSTWGNYIPLFHFSDCEKNAKNPRAHADYISEIPEEYNNDDKIDLEFEFKAKDLAIKRFEEIFNC
jgi:UV DNA damage endonuclease